MHRITQARRTSRSLSQVGGAEVVSDALALLISENESSNLHLYLEGDRGQKSIELEIRITGFYKRRGARRATITIERKRVVSTRL